VLVRATFGTTSRRILGSGGVGGARAAVAAISRDTRRVSVVAVGGIDTAMAAGRGFGPACAGGLDGVGRRIGRPRGEAGSMGGSRWMPDRRSGGDGAEGGHPGLAVAV
jgi:hypothetical protein